MDREIALRLTDLRLLQTLRLLESTMKDHPDQDAVSSVLDAITATRHTISKLSIGTPTECCA